MGSGKSYLGKQLAAALNYDFLDLDAFLEANEGMSISRIFKEGGESLFRGLECNYLQATIDFKQTVIATGGGTPCFFDNMTWMKANGLTVYLKTPVDLLVQRLMAETAHRPLLAGKTKGEMTQFIKAKLAERQFYYEQGQVLFEYKTGKETVADLLEKIGD